jgi:predicted esterase
MITRVAKQLTPRFGKATTAFAALFILALAGSLAAAVGVDDSPQSSSRWWPDTVQQALNEAGTNQLQLTQALERTPPGQREGMQFLVENMPAADRQTLPAPFLLENVALAYERFEQAAWHDRVPKEIFLNEVLPYACVNETRDAWRKPLGDMCAPLVADCKTPAQAAQRLNEQLFTLMRVKYSTARQKACQSPLESMNSGLASCTGLSILLIDACRAAGVPARFVGTPMWVNMRGNHSWVEIWDEGWHFTGAAEPDAKGLDHAWFEPDASQARKDIPRHAIYASSFKKTGLPFPMDWAPEVQWVSAINDTDRYTPHADATPAQEGKVRLLVTVLDHLAGQRVPAKVAVIGLTNSAMHLEGVSAGETADMNNITAFEVPPGIYDIRAERDGRVAAREFTAGTNAQAVVVISLNDTPVYKLPSQACYVAPPVAQNLKVRDEADLAKALLEFFTAPERKQARWKFSGHLERLLRDNEPAVRRATWEAFCKAPIHEAMKGDFDAKQVRYGEYLSPYTVRTVGAQPQHGWALFIAMHGGGGTAKEVNDSQWKVMQHYYRDHCEAGGYLYVALRAPNDTWNGFYDDYVYPLIDNLVRQFALFGGVDVNKVFIMGYSHGGYGAFAIGPKEPDLFAAIHASAAAPTDGETTGKTLRNTIFTCMVGEKDTAYGRISRDIKFRSAIQELRGQRADIYPVTVKIIPGNGHTGLPDRDMIQEMYPAARNPVPRELTWLMTDSVISNFFWLRSEAPAKQKEIDASCHENHIVVTTTGNPGKASVLLDSRLIDFSKPVTLEINGKSTVHTLHPSLRTLCQTLQRRGDPDLSFTCEAPISAAAEAVGK